MPVFEREIALGGEASGAAKGAGRGPREGGLSRADRPRGERAQSLLARARARGGSRDGAGAFRLAASGQELSGSKLLALIRNRPADVSPGVLLRPLMQDHLLPTAAYVGGPAEVAYWAQVYALYPLFDLAPPAVVPRAGDAARGEGREGSSTGSASIGPPLAGDLEAVVRAGAPRAPAGGLPDPLHARAEGWRRCSIA